MKKYKHQKNINFVKRVLHSEWKMAQMHREDVESVTADKKVSDGGGGGGGGGSSGTQASSFKFNAEAPEFVPQSRAAVPTPQVSPISGYFYPCFHYSDGGGTAVGSQASDWFFVGGGDPAQHPHVHDPAAAFYVPSPAVQFPVNQNSSPSSSLLSDDLRLKIVKQVNTSFISRVIVFLIANVFFYFCVI